ncbi:MAG: HTTM domain-containing protein [Myxococcota bacterium]
MTERLRLHLATPVDGASLVAFRVAFGLAMAANALRYEAKGWVHDLYVAPELAFPFVEGLERLPGPAMHGVFAVVFLSAIGIASGVAHRFCTAVFLVAFSYLELVDRTTYLNHYYLVSLLAALMLAMPLGRSGTLGRRRIGQLPRWCLWTLRLQLGLVYVFAGLAKLRGDWLLRAEPLHTWLSRYAHAPLVGPLMDDVWLAYVFSWAGLFFDLFVVFFLLRRRTRPLAYAAVVGFHAVTALLFPIGVFPWLMILATPLFFEPSWPRRLWRGHAPPRIAATRRLPLPALAMLAAWFALQALLPLRQHLHGGNACWHEQGYRFAWNVMVMEKTGLLELRLRDAEGGETRLAPRELLSPLQQRLVPTQPDLIRDLARQVRARFEAEGYPAPVEVRADVWASLNGRPSQRLLDPNVDLAADAALPEQWILPLHRERPSR